MTILEDILNKLDPNIEDGLKLNLTKKIKVSLAHLPDKICVNMQEKEKLDTLQKIVYPQNSNEQVSYYNFSSQILILTPPFNFDFATYESLNKVNEKERFLMDVGTLIGLYQQSKRTEPDIDKFAPLANAVYHLITSDPDNSKTKEFWINHIDFLSEIISKDRYHIMGGISCFNCQESLLTWTIRHEIGHAVDKMIEWRKNNMFSENMFGGWEIYETQESAYMAYKTDGGEKESCIFFQACKDYPFTYDSGGDAQGATRIFMLDEYGVWCSYLKSAREQAVSNYQFASSGEWFAEAFAAYYGPKNNHQLSKDVCDFFENNIGKKKE